MVLFLTSSPYVIGADRALLSNDNEFVDRIRAVLPPYPRALFVAANPEDRAAPAGSERIPQPPFLRRECPSSPITFWTVTTPRMRRL